MRKKVNLAITASVIAVISFYSLRPLQGAGGSGPSVNFTLLHFLAYFSLAAAFLLHFHDSRRGHFLAALTAFLFGLMIELIQTQVPSRYFTYQDIAVNLGGSSIVMLDHRSSLVTEFIEVEDRILERIQQEIMRDF